MRTRSRRRSLIVAAVTALVALAGCTPGALDVEEEAVGATESPAPSASPESSEPTPSDEPVADGIDTSSWLEHATRDGDVTFRYPAEWELESSASQDPTGPSTRWYDAATLTAPNGQTLLQSTDFVDIGGACGPEDRYPIELLASEPADGSEDVQIAAVAVGMADGRWTFGVGLTADDRMSDADAPGCGWYFVHGSSAGGVSIGTRFAIASIDPDPLWTVATLDDARAYMETEEYATLLEILRSVRTS